MIARLKGVVEEINGNRVVLDVCGVGYEIYCTRACVSELSDGMNTHLIIYTEVKEDSIRLFGFADQLEKQVFLLLMQVKGIGPRTSADIVSKVDKLSLMRLIGNGDADGLQSVKGLGKKTAERIIFELRDRVGQYVVERHTQSSLQIEIETIEPAREALEALMALGFGRKDAERAIQQVRLSSESANLSSGDIVKHALRHV